MAQGYILHANTAYVPLIGPGVQMTSLAALGIDIPVGALMVAHSFDISVNGGPLFDGSWKRLDQDANVHDNLLLGKIADGTDVGPSINWPNGGTFGLRATCLAVFVGDVYPDIATILSPNARSDRPSNNINLIPYASCSIGEAKCLVIAAGHRWKSSATDAATIGALANFTNIANVVRPGSTGAGSFNYWQQDANTNTALAAQIMSINDSGFQSEGSTIALRSQIASGGGLLLDDHGMRGEL